MEFFRIIDIHTKEDHIRELLTLENLENMSNQLFVIGEQDKREARIGGIWGEFNLVRSEIKGGLRFALQECPNALAWSITTGFRPASASIVIHLTINRQEKSQEFLEEIDEFLEDHTKCLERVFSTHDLKKRTSWTMLINL